MAYRDFVSLVHKSTKRDYLARVTQRDKADVAEMAVKFDYDYWDGSRETGYGGYKYDGRWRKVADAVRGLSAPPEPLPFVNALNKTMPVSVTGSLCSLDTLDCSICATRCSWTSTRSSRGVVGGGATAVSKLVPAAGTGVPAARANC